MKKIFLLLILVMPAHAFCQFTKVNIGVNGLTCSACTRSVEMSLRKLPFVDSVAMDLENTSGRIFFKQGVQSDIYKIAKSVVDAGFSVRFLSADYTYSNNSFRADKIKDGDYEFYFLKPKTQNKQWHLQFTGPDFQSKKEFNKTKQQFPGVDFSNEKMYYVIPVSEE